MPPSDAYVLPIRRRWQASAVSLLPFLAAAALLGYAAWILSADVAPAETTRQARLWTLIWTATLAVLPPHLLLPDPQTSWLRHPNPAPGRLLRRQLARGMPLLATTLVPYLTLAARSASPEATLHTGGHLLLAAALGLFALARYLTMGPRVQDWHDGRRGRRLRAWREETGQSLFVPDGLVPTLTTTGSVVAVGLLGIVVLHVAERAHVLGALVPGLGVLLWSAGLWVRAAPSFDRLFYSAGAVFGEIFYAGPSASLEKRAPLPFESLYWVPPRLRPHVWMSLLQLDRRLPLGRLVWTAHAGSWVLALAGAGAPALTVYLGVVLILQNASVLLIARPAFAPAAFTLTRLPASGWTAARFFVNARWLLPLVLSLGVLLLVLDAPLDGGHAARWLLADMALAFACALGATYLNESRTLRRYA